MRKHLLPTLYLSILLLAGWGVLGARVQADAPLFLSTDVYYPSHLARPSLRQTALKDGDRTYLVVIINHPAVTTSVVADLSPLGGSATTELPKVHEYIDGNTGPNLLRQFQSDFLTVASGAHSGPVTLQLTATDEFGVVATSSVTVLLDAVKPVFTTSEIYAASSTPLVQFDVLSVSGSMTDAESTPKVYQVLEQELAADGQTVLYESVYGSTHPAATNFYTLGNGSFSDIPLALYTANGASTFPSDAYFIRFIFTIADSADNYAYGTSTTISIANPPIAPVPATTTPDIATSTEEVATSTEVVAEEEPTRRRGGTLIRPPVLPTVEAVLAAPLTIPVPTKTQVVTSVSQEPEPISLYTEEEKPVPATTLVPAPIVDEPQATTTLNQTPPATHSGNALAAAAYAGATTNSEEGPSQTEQYLLFLGILFTVAAVGFALYISTTRSQSSKEF